MTTSAEIEKKLAKGGNSGLFREITENFFHVPTGILALDIALLGGPATGQITQIIGRKSAGKSTTAFIISAAFQRAFPGEIVAYLDVEQTLDASWATVYGVDLSRFKILRPENGEQAADLVDAYLRATDVCLVVLDSVAAMKSQKLFDKSADDVPAPALDARLMSILIAKTANAMAIAKNRQKRQPTLLALNFWRSKIVQRGDSRNAPGGSALEQMSFSIVDLKNKEEWGSDPVLKGKQVALMNTHSFVMEKAKAGGSVKEAEYKITRHESHAKGTGYIDQIDQVWFYGRKFGLITGSNAKFVIDGFGISGKKKEITDFLEQKDNQELLDVFCHEILSRARAYYGKSRAGWRAGNYQQVDLDWGNDGTVLNTDDED